MTVWLEEHAITVRDWGAAVRHDLLVDRLEDEFAGELSRYIPLVHARACRPVLRAGAARSTDASTDSLHDLLQPLAVESDIPMVATYDELARRLGFPSVSDLAEAVKNANQTGEA